MEMSRRNFLALGTVAFATLPVASWSCQPSRKQCDAVPDNSFQRGTVKRPADCIIDFRLPSEIVQAITRRKGDPTGPAGSYDWTLRLITFDQSGRPVWQQAHKVSNQPSKRQGVYFGTTGAVYVTCDKYTGWYTTGPIRSCGQPTFKKVNWPFDYKQLERMTS